MTEETHIEKIARWANTLNSWEWPDDLGGKPDGWDSMPSIARKGDDFVPNKYDWSGSILSRIDKIIGHKEFLRWHHIHNLNRTNEEFETWWNDQYA
jgi:hypothetical protein